MPIYLEGGQILIDGGAIAVHEDCCCEGEIVKVKNCLELLAVTPGDASIEVSFNWGRGGNQAAFCDACNVPPTSAVLPFLRAVGGQGLFWGSGTVWTCGVGLLMESLSFNANIWCPNVISDGNWVIGADATMTSFAGGNSVYSGALYIPSDQEIEFGRDYHIPTTGPVFQGTHCYSGPAPQSQYTITVAFTTN